MSAAEPGGESSLRDPACRRRLLGIAVLLLGNPATAQEALHRAACRAHLAAGGAGGGDPALVLPRSLLAEVRSIRAGPS